MEIFGLSITRAKQAPGTLASVDSRGGWWPLTIRESFTGAWQSNVEVSLTNVLTYSAVWACVTLIASDIAKLRIKLVQQDADGVWTETDNPAFSPVLRKPNHYQNRMQFVETWQLSKQIHGNTYVLKQRDNRGVVVGLYVLDPTRVRPLVAEDGSVWYSVSKDWLSHLQQDRDGLLAIPAREIIHDRNAPLFHPLVGLSPITACGVSAVQALRIMENSAVFFANGAQPSGVLSAPGAISDPTAARLKEYWNSNFTGANAGRVAVAGDGLKYEPITMRATDAQLIEQLRWTAEDACIAFHMPPYKVNVGPPPAYDNVEKLNQQYYSACLQDDIEMMELLLDEGLALPKPFGTEFDLDGLMRMDMGSRVTAAGQALAAGMTINEARKRFHDLPSVEGGDTVYLQQQNFSLEALAKRDAQADPFATNAPEPEPDPEPDPEPEPEPEIDERMVAEMVRKAWAA